MSHYLTGAIGFAALFALAGVYALLRPRQDCSGGGCGSCASAGSCELAGHHSPDEHAE